MENILITEETITEFRRWLHEEDRSGGTIEMYIRDITRLMLWLGDRPLSRETVTAWKEALISRGYAPVTVNSMLAAVNTFCRFCDVSIRIRFLRIQRKLFREERRELSKAEYERLIQTAEETGKHRLALIIETIGATGIRVSELKYITAEALEQGKAQIALKGKIRVILLPGKLCRKLRKYAQKQKITSGEIFLTGGGKGISRKQVWAEMKALCGKAGVDSTKVFPHNLRHLFAHTYYKSCRDIVQLADVLGHSSIETTRIYLIGTGKEHARRLNCLGLVS